MVKNPVDLSKEQESSTSFQLLILVLLIMISSLFCKISIPLIRSRISRAISDLHRFFEEINHVIQKLN